MDSTERELSLKNFTSGISQFLFANDTIYPLPVNNVIVINYDVPQEKTVFERRLGKTGREFQRKGKYLKLSLINYHSKLDYLCNTC